MGLMDDLFGKKLTPEEHVKKWRSEMRHEQRALDRQIRNIEREEGKAKRSCKEAAKRGDRDICKILAKEIVQSRKAVNKIHASKAQLNSVMMNMQAQLATAKMAGTLQKSSEVMAGMNALVKVPEIRETMMNMSKEMTRAGLMEEMIEDAMEMGEDEDLEDEADEEVNKILFQITDGLLGEGGAVGAKLEQQQAEAEDAKEDEIMKRLNALNG